VPEFFEGSGAISGYPLQSFSGEKPEKGFPLLSGLGYRSSKEVLIHSKPQQVIARFNFLQKKQY